MRINSQIYELIHVNKKKKINFQMRALLRGIIEKRKLNGFKRQVTLTNVSEKFGHEHVFDVSLEEIGSMGHRRNALVFRTAIELLRKKTEL